MSDLKCPIFADANLPKELADGLRALGYDVLTVQQYQKSSRPEHGLSDELVLQTAVKFRRIICTLDRFDFLALHRANPSHKGMILIKRGRKSNLRRILSHIDDAIKSLAPLDGKAIRVNDSGYCELT
jgi:hypothetical protein